ncbi:MAG: endonuclease III [bacterium]|nr:MAG: endonuclease III [bacterium]
MTDAGADLIRERLHTRYGLPAQPPRLAPLDELVRTILSQNTNDRNRDTAYRALKDRFGSWKEVLQVSRSELAGIISPAGLGPTKSRRIRDILSGIYEKGERDLLKLCSLPPREALERLLALKGVGPKTAACVLLFSCGHPAFPVDTHIHRIAGRLGLLPEGADRHRAHERLGDLFPQEHYLELHLNLIRLGREVCRPNKPLCPACPIQDLCRWAAGRAQAGERRAAR